MNFRLNKIGRVWHYYFRLNGRRYRASTKTETKELALKCTQQIYNEVYQNQYKIKPARTRINDFIEYHLKADRANISPDWHYTKALILNAFLEYTTTHCGVQYLDQIELSHLETYKTGLLDTVKPKTAKNYIMTVKAMLNHAVKLRYLTESPGTHLSPIRQLQKNKQRFLSKVEIKTLLKASAGSRLNTLILTAIYTGMRRGELLNLEFQDIDTHKKIIYIRNKDGFTTKSRKERVLPLHDKLAQIFAGKRKGLCFTNDRGRKIQKDTITRQFKRLTASLDMPDVGLHTLRHTFISQCLMANIGIWEVSHWAGHSSSIITESVYGHLCPDRREIERLKI